MCMCSFNLLPFLPQFASSCDDMALRKLSPVKRSRPRRKVRPRHAKRAWCDSLIYSNLVYALAALISFSCDQNFCGVLQMGAAIASTMFHRSKETKYLLLDALISGTLGIIFIFAGQHTLNKEWYGILAIKLVLAVLCVFTWLYCGMPGGERYDKWHNRWHYVSGATTISTTLFLTMYMPEFDLLMHELIQDVVVVRSMFS
ncbi:hypothetical protein F441_14417 [Phytophthora nicotianae CJ01A1]|uniref:Uncharacterized protein n=6 Tax=Phytophthora nicotianae TaxID=4792 RepID=W2PUM9_PHYN3|nr:hypothetical protein PPTG_14991 [Phytophthora nicotianae INRA-310]ETI39933.1 hypothetical protein F443_14545 [Phytophthora nicotianae P1569]ETK80012.1 hypothetical protein L915_14187 [Phytophthora nicotianae]ETO68625.1 hypothetical protein F444_14555 [Phytophthora nicotianae P1976]ETP09763.1 hypothetical protein F441_14417 [Phytophthora nicotianae CJ01A1]ETP37785.1 hypothetical protein F442_14381 [Phytophthora nicotianae P10297]KUG00192.1 hypothetical protein AM587_10016680 [Phytophthora n